jgi:hypothetical protein
LILTNEQRAHVGRTEDTHINDDIESDFAAETRADLRFFFTLT